MTRHDGRLHLVRTRTPQPRGLLEERNRLPDRGAVPQAPVLMLEQHEARLGSQARAVAGPVETDQREQAEDLRLIGQEAGEQRGEPFPVLGQVPPRGRGPARGQIPFIEQQVEHAQHIREARGEIARPRHAVRDPRLHDLPLGTHDPLRGRGLRRKERARDLPRGQPENGPQRERDLRLARERGMAAREDQPEAVVGLARRLPGVRADALQQRLVAALAAPSVDPPAPGGRHEPRRGPLGDAFDGPVLERGDQRVLDEVFGVVEIAERADERAGQPAGLLAHDAGDRGVARRDRPALRGLPIHAR